MLGILGQRLKHVGCNQNHQCGRQHAAHLKPRAYKCGHLLWLAEKWASNAGNDVSCGLLKERVLESQLQDHTFPCEFPIMPSLVPTSALHAASKKFKLAIDTETTSNVVASAFVNSTQVCGHIAA